MGCTVLLFVVVVVVLFLGVGFFMFALGVFPLP